MTKKVKITGHIGSWFAKVGDQNLPIMWGDEVTVVDGRKILRTDWVETAREKTASKREGLIAYFEPSLHEEIAFIIAQAKDVTARPREIEKYVGVFSGIVRQVVPEIELEIVERIAHSK